MMIKKEIFDVFFTHKLNSDLIEVRNLCDVAELIVRSAMERKESRGIHFNINYPAHEDDIYTSVLKLNLFTNKYQYHKEHPFIELDN